VLFALTRPPHVKLDGIVIKAIAQSSGSRVVRRSTTAINMEWGVPQRSFPVERCRTPH
jgi:hypothetical protein